MIKLENLGVRRGNRQVLDAISFSAGAGELIGVIGPNGAGKSTLMQAVIGLVRSTGTIEIAGNASGSMKAKDLAKLVAYLPQEREVAWGLTVEKLVALGRIPSLSGFSQVSQKDLEIVETAINQMEVGHLKNACITKVSGGERARVLMARALAQDTPILIADEPAAGLDPEHQIHLMAILSRIANQGKTVLVSLHDLNLAARWCSRLLVLESGKMRADGNPDVVLDSALVEDVFKVRSVAVEVEGQRAFLPVSRVDQGQGGASAANSIRAQENA
ncbi:ABC transporter ATP-binding protein [Pseudovibrio flavus]|uniref:ABC transporter ATP-binding protein n=1 Tax=Pseudovibrio flavus TaxID=2529854 RepID=UPI00211C4F7C|nr:ABC transporter ATP-binding protein [Pseudovibrio flavus]